MIRLKKGVRYTGIQPELVLTMMLVETIFDDHGYTMTVTSIVDGIHSPTSLHYAGAAFDVRTNDIPDGYEKDSLIANVIGVMNPDVDVLFEHQGKPNEHLHIEFQPRYRGH